MQALSRNLRYPLLDALSDTPVVFIAGARQVGKSTLVQSLVAEGSHPARYLTFDNKALLTAVREDPEGFLRRLDGPVILDEVQRVPELFLPIKAAVDEDRRPGRFLLTGSANVMILPELSRALVGRMEVMTLGPFSVGEPLGLREAFIDWAFGSEPPASNVFESHPSDITEQVFRGGYPELLQRERPRRREAWFDSYIETLVQRDIRELSQIEEITRIPRILGLLAARSGGLLNQANMAGAAGVPVSSLVRYLMLLEAVYLTFRLPAWSSNLGKRLVKAPKLYLGDSGLCAHLMGMSPEAALVTPDVRGPLFETFVISELNKQRSWARSRVGMYHYRSHSGAEVDLLLEDRAGRIVAIEIKAAAVAKRSDARNLIKLRELLGPRFVRGIVLYQGQYAFNFDERIEALPVEALWREGSVPG